jgi:hypothetical protein
MKRLLLFLAVVALALPAAALAAKARKTSGTAWVSANHTEGANLYVSGDIKDKLLGRGAIVYVVKAQPTSQPGTVLVKASRVTVFLPGGSLSGTGQATQTLNPDGTATVTNGSFTLTKGTGAYKGRRLTGSFGGPFKDGTYTFTYKATYK